MTERWEEIANEHGTAALEVACKRIADLEIQSERLRRSRDRAWAGQDALAELVSKLIAEREESSDE